MEPHFNQSNQLGSLNNNYSIIDSAEVIGQKMTTKGGMKKETKVKGDQSNAKTKRKMRKDEQEGSVLMGSEQGVIDLDIDEEDDVQFLEDVNENSKSNANLSSSVGVGKKRKRSKTLEADIEEEDKENQKYD